MERSYKLYRDFSDKWGKDGNWVIDLANVMFLFAILADAAIKRHRIQMAYGVTEFFESIAAKGCFSLYLSYFYLSPDSMGNNEQALAAYRIILFVTIWAYSSADISVWKEFIASSLIEHIYWIRSS